LPRGSLTRACGDPAPAPGAARGAAPAPGRGRGSMVNSAFTDMMLTDLIPMVEKTFRVAPGRDNRAMAGLSMGGAQTFGTALENLDKFAYIGGLRGRRSAAAGAADSTPRHPMAACSPTRRRSTRR